eukprot:g2960.t1
MRTAETAAVRQHVAPLSAIRSKRRRRPGQGGVTVPTFKVNEEVVRAVGGKKREVRLIMDGGEANLSPVGDALRQAKDSGLDLVLVAEKSKPPTCRIRDNKKHMFEMRKKALEKRKASKVAAQKDVQFKVNIDTGDFERQVNAASEFLRKGHPVKVTVKILRRIANAPQVGRGLLEEVFSATQSLTTQGAAAIEAASGGKQPKMPPLKSTGHLLILNLTPLKSQKMGKK